MGNGTRNTGGKVRMIDKERLIKAWGIFQKSNPYEICEGREFRAIKEPEYCMGQMISDTIALLKEQEKVSVKQREIMHMLFWCCGSCGVAITYGDKFCRNCGKAVKWE